MSESLRIVSIFPELLGTYGDAGNVMALQYQCRLHNIACEVVTVEPGDTVPREGDLYVLGGGEDSAQTAAVEALSADGGLTEVTNRGAQVVAICAGYQLLGKSFPGAAEEEVPGLGILDMTTTRLPVRAVGELLAEANIDIPYLTGYENHGGRTILGPGLTALAQVQRGVGNGHGGGEGVITDQIVATYLHGPGLARNPRLADFVIGRAVGRELAAIPQPEIDDLRAERLRSLRQ